MPRVQIAAFALIIAVGIAAAWWLRNHEFIFHGIAASALATVIVWVRRTIPLSDGVLWIFVACGAAHMAGGLVPVPAEAPTTGSDVLYNLWVIPRIVRYDHVVHAVGFGAAAVAWWQVLHALAPSLRPTVGPMLFCWVAAQGCGALNEVAEYAAVQVLDRTNVGDFDNAMLDLVANGAGAGVAVVVLSWRARLTAESAFTANSEAASHDFA